MYPPQPPQSSSNPYQSVARNNFYPSYYNAHYVQAYSQQRVAVNQNNSSGASTSSNHATQGSFGGRDTRANPRPFGYQPGNARCSHSGCTFTGSAKTVEIHMMDRHLIFPPGWEKRKKKPEWDADPSLKGKPIPIQGTNIILDTPEILEAWINERKNRFPTAARVADKKRKFDEAVARGQLDLSESRWPNKRRNLDSSVLRGAERGRRPRQNNSRGRFQGGMHREPQALTNPNLPPKPEDAEHLKTKRGEPQSASSESPSDSEEDSDDQPEAVSSKLVPVENMSATDENKHTQNTGSTPSSFAKKIHPQPRQPPNNPFASRPTLLRNLLLPEIRVTISNLSQAIRFLVDNDFLRDVELKPGQAAESHKIEVIEPEQIKQSENIT